MYHRRWTWPEVASNGVQPSSCIESRNLATCPFIIIGK